MAHSYSRNHIHLVFSTKERRNSIPKEWQARLWAYIAGICKNYEMIVLDSINALQRLTAYQALQNKFLCRTAAIFESRVILRCAELGRRI